MGFSLVVVSRGYSLVKHELWGARASVVGASGLSSCDTWA